uniref:Uncharacterized protein n=1 Tax=Triticum urartu TaxID=4572 RepID=A0A8R7PIU9_TRIUA
MAFFGFTCPAPVAKYVACVPSTSANGFFLLSVVSVVVISADLMAAGDHVGCAFFSSAATPARCGHDMDVPDLTSNLGISALGGNTKSAMPGTPASMFTPGPMMSGFRIPRLCRFGPRAEKGAIIGDRGVSNDVPFKMKFAVASFSDCT